MRLLAGLLVCCLVLSGCLGGGPAPGDDAVVDAPRGGFSDTDVFAGEYVFDAPYSMVLEPGPLDRLPWEVLSLSSDVDGAAIQMAVARPDVPDGAQVPVVVLASPYFPPLQAAALDRMEPRLVENYVPHGYAVAFLAVRGTADSGGCIELFGPAEAADLDQAVTWLGTQDWSNGNVGMVGVSYDGSTPWMVAALGNPHLKTIVPISGLSDVYSLGFRNGTSELRMLGLVNALYYAYGFAFNHPGSGRSVAHTVDGVACPAFVEGTAASAYSAAHGGRDPLGFWDARNHRAGVEGNYDGSVFLVQGLQDWNVNPSQSYPWVRHLEDQGFVVKHLLGQWGHAWPDGSYLNDDLRRHDFAEVLLHWFDHWLKEEEGVDLGPRVQVQDSLLRWRSEEAWPPADALTRTLYLAPGWSLSEEPAQQTASLPVGPDGSLLYGEPASMPELCSLCVAFFTEDLEEDLHVVGWPRLHVTATPAGPTGHLSAFLYAWQEGQWTRLGWTQMDLRFADGTEEMRPLVPGQSVVARMQFEPLDAVAPAGSRLAVVLSQGQENDRLHVPPSAPVTVEVGGEKSTLVFGSVVRGDGAFFTPPRPS